MQYLQKICKNTVLPSKKKLVINRLKEQLHLHPECHHNYFN